MKNLTGTEFLRLNMDVEDRSRDSAIALEALRSLEQIATELGLPGVYLRDSLRRYLDRNNSFKTLDQSFGLASVVGPPLKGWSEKDAKIAYKCFERRLRGVLAKQLDYKGYSKRTLTQIQSRYLDASIYKARKKRGEKGFSGIEKKRLGRLLSVRKKAIANLRESERWN